MAHDYITATEIALNSDRTRINADAARLETSKQQFADSFVSRTEFAQKYSANLSGEQFIDACFRACSRAPVLTSPLNAQTSSAITRLIKVAVVF